MSRDLNRGASAHRHTRFRFGEFEFDTLAARLRHRGVEVAVTAKPLALLEHLIRESGRVVPREELLGRVWSGTYVSDAALASALRDVRRALGDEGARSRFVQTVRGVGFRFTGEVEAIEGPSPGRGFVGRREPLRRVEALLADLRDGDGRCLWLGGEAGIGKTRLLVEIAARAGEVGVETHFGRCLEEGGGAPYRPWVEIVRRLVAGLEPGDVAGRFGALAAEAQRLLPERAGTQGGRAAHADGQAERMRLFDAVTELLRRAAEERPLALVFDDLHRADDATAILLRHVVRELPRLRVLLLGAYRPNEVPAGHPLADALGGSEPGMESTELAGLDESEVATLASSILGDPVSGPLADALSTRTRGNPLFVVQIARSLADQPDKRTAHAERALPLGICQAIATRLHTLGPATRLLLEVASVVGREFDVDILLSACEQRDAEPLDAAVRAGVIEPAEADPRRLRFTHILARDALYEEIPPLRRARLHGDVGRAIESLRAHRLEEHLSDLAHHFGEAAALGEAPRAVRYARAAGEGALQQAAYEDAARLFELALRLLELCADAHAGDPRSQRAELLVALGQARWRLGDTDASRDAFRDAAAIAHDAGYAETLARAALGYAGRTDADPSVNDTSLRLMEQALAALPQRDTALRCELLARLGTELYYGSDPARCDRLTLEALEMAERLDDFDARAYALTARSYALMRPGVAVEQPLALCERTIALATEASDVRALGLQEKALCLLMLGDTPRFDASLREFSALADELRQPFFRWMASVLRGARLFLGGRIDDAERAAHETLALGQRFGTDNAAPMFAVQLLYVRREQGRSGELEGALRSLLDDSAGFPAFRSALPPMYLELGRKRDARDVIEQMMARNLDDLPRDQHWVPALAMLGGACAALNDAARARQLYDLLLPDDGKLIVAGHGGTCDGAVSHHLARLAATFGDLDLAEEHFDAALSLERRAGARLFAARTQQHWAALLWKRGAPREREQARELAAAAIQAYGALGLTEHARLARRTTS